METHKTLFSEDRVVCLAQVLVNMEILGTTYVYNEIETKACKLISDLIVLDIL